MKILRGRTAAITGAGSGIGRALAVELAKKGCALALSDIDEKGLAETAQQVSTLGQDVSTHSIDVANASEMDRFAQEALAAHDAVHILINNAGLTCTANFLEHDLSHWQHIIGVNLMGVVHGCRSFIPHMLTLKEAHIVNISSLFGLVGVPGQTAYCTSKFAVRGLSESLWMELTGSPIGLTVVHPGGVSTQIAKNSHYTNNDLKQHMTRIFEKNLMTPQDAALRIIVGIERNQRSVLITREAKIAALLKRLLPVRAVRMFSEGMLKSFRLRRFESNFLLHTNEAD